MSNLVVGADGVKSIPSLSSYIGNDVDAVIDEIKKDRNVVIVTDCIGIKGFRIITLTGLEKKIEILCETVQFQEVLSEKSCPSQAVWHIIDIFNYIIRPKEGKGFY